MAFIGESFSIQKVWTKGPFTLTICIAWDRSLSGICSYNLVCDSLTLQRVTGRTLPQNYYPALLTEAIFQREVHSIVNLISTWPMTWLRIFDVLPLEDYLENEYLTQPFEDDHNVCLLDYIILGLLTLHEESFLQVVDFSQLERGNMF